MRLRFIWVGKTKDRRIAALTDEYLTRLGRYIPCEITVVKERSGSDEAESEKIIETESQALAQAMHRDSYSVLLDIDGQMFSSPELAKMVDARRNEGTKELTFIVGGFLGVTQQLKQSARLRLSLSRLTLTHELARVILTEQVYRAFTILHGHPYQK